MSGWRTNFYYQQDLKSEEMNGVFNSSLIPGVYNADVKISATDGISLFNVNIAAGTTLIFSNRTCSRDNKYYRQFADFSNLAKYNYYTIKSTAETDLVATVPPVGGKYTLPDRFYLVAVMPYGDPKDDSPVFRLAEPPKIPNPGDPLIKEINATNDSYVFYDGLPDGDFNDAVAYLIIGEFIRIGDPVTTYTSGALSFDQFFGNYIFTRRGLEEYRYSFSTDKNTPVPDFSYTQSLDAIKIYWSTFTANSILFKGADTRGDYYDEFIKTSTVSSLSLPKDPEVSGSGVVYDFIFAAFQDAYQDRYDLSTLMTDTSYPSVPVLYSCKWIQDIADDFPVTEFNLAEGITPQFNLLNRVAGRPILSRVATAIKRGDAPVYSATGELADISPETLSTIIPVALVMRPFVDGVGASKCAVGSAPRLNPEFVVSYFDIYQGANECNSIGLSKEDIYSTVAILD